MSIARTIRLRRSRRRRGQGLVEFALVLPIFLLMLFGIIDLGRYVYMNSTLSQAAREGARLAAVEASWIGSTDASCGAVAGPTCPASVAGLRSDVLVAVNRMLTPFGPITDADLHISCDATTSPSGSWTSPPRTCAAHGNGQLVSVRVVMDYVPITPVIGQLLGTLHTAASVTMKIN